MKKLILRFYFRFLKRLIRIYAWVLKLEFWKRFLIFLALMIISLACQPAPPCDSCCPVCPECDSCCPECLECPPDYTLIKEALEWRCELPLPDRVPEDYITLSRGEDIIHNVDEESRSDIHLSIDSGVRDEEYAAFYCGSKVEAVFKMSASDMRAMVAEGRTLIDKWERRFRNNLKTLNWRAKEDIRFRKDPLRSNVYEKNWDPYVERLKSHRKQANLNRQLAKLDPRANCNFDSVKGWCQCRNGVFVSVRNSHEQIL